MKNEEEDIYLSRFQSLAFNSQLQNGTPSQKADVLRNIIVHLNLAPYHRIVSEETSNSIIKHYQKQYEEIVDCFDETSGLNNFAAGALALCSGMKNESQQWKTSLESSKVEQMPFFKEYTERRKDKTDFLSKFKENSKPLFTPRKKKLVPETLEMKPENPKYLQLLPRHFTNSINQASKHTPPIIKATSVNQLPGNAYLQTTDNRQTNHSTKSCQVSVNQNNMNNGRNNYEQNVSRTSQYSQKNSLFSDWSSSTSCRENYNDGKCNQRHNDWRKRQRETDDEDEQNPPLPGPFKTARDQMAIEQQKKYGDKNRGHSQTQGQFTTSSYGGVKKSLGTRRGASSKFIPPVMNKDEDGYMMRPDNKAIDGNGEEPVDERLKGIDPKMIELINNEIMDHGPKLTWEDVAGLEFAKKTIKEIVVWPILRPDIFTGLRGPPKGLLLFGPPGTGKTLIGKCIASQSRSTFFCISASSLTSKWVGEGEKMVRALFAVARCNQPAVIFIDEIDSLLSQRSDNEHEASRRIKTEFLVQLDGAATDSDDRFLIIGATNRPHEIDEAARRRFVKRLYIPLPEDVARRQIVVNMMTQQKHNLTDQNLDMICQKSEGYSGSDMANLCREAALGPIRSIPFDQIETITSDEVRAINFQDFMESLNQVRASVSLKDLDLYIEWNKQYGSFGK